MNRISRVRVAVGLACWVASMVVGCASGWEAFEKEEKHKPDSPLQAARFRAQQRQDADGREPANALMDAKIQRDAMIAAGHVSPPSAGDAPWTWLGPGNIGGRLRAVVIHPTTPNTMWIGSCSGGIWKTTDGGALWNPMDDFLPSLSIGCMIVDPFSPDTLYAGTGEGFFETIEGSSNTAAIRGAGIFKTTNGGTNWQQLASTATPDFYFVNRLAMSPENTSILMAATSTGIFRSTNAGVSWTKVHTDYVYDLQWHPTNAQLAVAGRHDGTPLYTTNGGLTWQAATGATGHRVELRYAKSAPTNVYAAVANTGTVKLWKSTNGGQTYAALAAGTIGTYEAYNIALWVDPTNPNVVLLGGIQMYRSTNGGASLGQVFTGLHADHHVISEHPQFNGTTNKTVFFGHDGGVSRTLDHLGSATSNLNNNVGVTQFYGAAMNPTSGVLIAGAQDNGTSRYTGNPQAWQSVMGGDGSFCAADQTDPNYFYAQFQRLSISRSSNGGSSFSGISSGLTDTGTLDTNFISYIYLDPNNQNRMLACAKRLWRSNNVKGPGTTWAIIKQAIGFAPPSPAEPDPSHMVGNDPFNISTVVVAQGNSDIIWVGHNNGNVYKTSNGTSANPTWTRVDENGPSFLPDRWVGRIVIDKNDANRVTVAFMGWNAGNVWQTTNAGATWTDISGSGASALPSVPVSAIAQHPLQSSRFFAGTDIGMFETVNNGAAWSAIVPGVGTVPVDELNWKDNNTLIVVTHGRGVYLGDVSGGGPPCYPDCDTNGALAIDDFICFQTLFAIGDPYADCDGDSALTIDDFICFQTFFALGC